MSPLPKPIEEGGRPPESTPGTGRLSTFQDSRMKPSCLLDSLGVEALAREFLF